MSEAKPIVWAYRYGRWPHGDEPWVAIADDGRVITNHVSSSREWGQHDVGPTGFNRSRYVDLLGTADVDYRVVPDGETPPRYVLERNHALADADTANTATQDGGR